METEGLLDYQGRAEIISIVRWTLRPVIFGVANSRGPGGAEQVGCVFFWYGDVSFAVSGWPKSPFWYGDLFLVSGCILLFSI